MDHTLLFTMRSAYAGQGRMPRRVHVPVVLEFTQRQAVSALPCMHGSETQSTVTALPVMVKPVITGKIQHFA